MSGVFYYKALNLCRSNSSCFFFVLKTMTSVVATLINSLFHTKNTASVTENSRSRSLPVLFTFTYFSYTYSLFFHWKIKSCFDLCFPQQIRAQTTLQWYILQDYSSTRIGFNTIKKRHTLPIVYTMLVKIR